MNTLVILVHDCTRWSRAPPQAQDSEVTNRAVCPISIGLLSYNNNSEGIDTLLPLNS